MKKLAMMLIICSGALLTVLRVSQKPAKLPEQSTVLAQPARPTLTASELPLTLTPLPTFTAHVTPRPGEINPTPSAPSPTPHWIYYPPGEIYIPVLLYHHIGGTGKSSRYTISPDAFEAQMLSLKDWGYTTIPVSLLVTSITKGAYLPLKPIVITFDDGYRDVYQNALPIMERYGFAGTLYVIVNHIGGNKYIKTAQLNEFVAKGWEIGSHSMTHANLRKTGTNLTKEIMDSRLYLEDLLSTAVTSFAYPYGISSPAINQLVRDAGYKAGMGLGTSNRHTEKSRYYLSRKEVQGNFDLIAFAGLLQGDDVISDP